MTHIPSNTCTAVVAQGRVIDEVSSFLIFLCQTNTETENTPTNAVIMLVPVLVTWIFCLPIMVVASSHITEKTRKKKNGVKEGKHAESKG